MQKHAHLGLDQNNRENHLIIVCALFVARIMNNWWTTKKTIYYWILSFWGIEGDAGEIAVPNKRPVNYKT